VPRSISVALGLVAWAATATGATETTPLTLAEALAIAEAKNPDIQSARESATAENVRAEAVMRQRWPSLALSSGYYYTNNPSAVFAHKLNSGQFSQEDFAIDRLNAPDALSHLNTTLALQVPLDVFGKVGAYGKAQAAAGQAAFAATREGLQELRLQVVRAYHQAALARRAVAVTERAVETARAREADMEARVAEGAALKADLLRARARRRTREAELAERRGETRVAGAALARLLGADPGTEYEPAEAPPEPEPLQGEEESWSARAATQRAAQETASRKVEATEWALKGEDKSLLPDLALFGQVQDDRNTFGSNQTGSVGAMLRFNAFDGSRSKRKAVAEASLRAAQQQARAVADQVRLEVAMAFRRAMAARERFAAAAGGAEDGREALRVIQERRQAGMATLTDELETEVASLAAELGELEARTAVAIADAELRRAAGEL
jgi:outer membrane protein TolC